MGSVNSRWSDTGPDECDWLNRTINKRLVVEKSGSYFENTKVNQGFLYLMRLCSFCPKDDTIAVAHTNWKKYRHLVN